MKENNGPRQMVFFPDFLFREAVAAFIVVAAIIALSLLSPMKVGDPADPSDSSFKPVPEWYFMAPYFMLKLFPSSLEIVPTVLTPGLLFLALLIWPFIDKKEERSPKKRPVSIAVMAIGVLVTIAFTVLGIYSH